MMSLRHGTPIDELTVPSLVTICPSKLKILHFVCKWDRITNRQTIQLLNASGIPFRLGT